MKAGATDHGIATPGATTGPGGGLARTRKKKR